jgi:hypothetical protein
MAVFLFIIMLRDVLIDRGFVTQDNNQQKHSHDSVTN